jgi:hypothetical protein
MVNIGDEHYTAAECQEFFPVRLDNTGCRYLVFLQNNLPYILRAPSTQKQDVEGRRELEIGIA